VAHGGLHGVTLAEILVNGFGFCGRLNNDEAIGQDGRLSSFGFIRFE
jgi:hypothetical protein